MICAAAPVDGVNICVQVAAHHIVGVRMLCSDTIKRLKLKVEEMEGIAVEQQQLLVNGRTLRDECVLAQSGVAEGSMLRLMLGVRGGMQSTGAYCETCVRVSSSTRVLFVKTYKKHNCRQMRREAPCLLKLLRMAAWRSRQLRCVLARP